MSDYPCWFSKKDLYIAQALVEKSGFVYIGKEEEFCIGYSLAKCHKWQLASAYGEIVLDAVRDGALFSKSLEGLPDIDFEEEVKTALKTIKDAAKSWEALHPPRYEQLSLLESIR